VAIIPQTLCVQREFCINCNQVSGNTRHITPCVGTVAGSQGLRIYESTILGKNTSLNAICIPPTITSISDFAFRDVPGITDVTFSVGSRLGSIGTGAFERSPSLASIEIPATVTNIGNWAFDGVSTLTSVTFAPGSMLETIGFYAFRRTSITSIIIPDSVITIGLQAFAFCTSLTNVTISASINSIGTSAFSGCSNLTTVTVHATTPPSIGGFTVFSNTNPNLQIRVPPGSVQHYRDAWGHFLPAPGAARIVGF
jgi:hypothetical protein